MIYPGGDHHIGPSPRRMSSATDKKDRVLADGAAVQGERDRSGGTGIV